MEFLFENLWLFAVVIGIITSLFNKAKGGQGKQTNRPRQSVQPQSAANQQKGRSQQEVRNKNVPPVMPKNNIEKEHSVRKKQAEEQIQALKDKQKDLVNTGQSLQMAPPRGSSRMDSVPYKEKKTALSIEKQKLADGVIWAEILGPPRALNPHKSIRQKR
ncbi:hypothetical protein ACTHO0_07550 [Cytobacillus praedii]|uniref:hypothetical protein n=1 Tax=Cytobacillus praedii TaxID=1742358 RepID=UPI003F804B37